MSAQCDLHAVSSMDKQAILHSNHSTPLLAGKDHDVANLCSMIFKSLLKSTTDSCQDAVAALNTLQSNFAVVDAIRKSGKSMNQQAIPEMIEWTQRIGYQVCSCLHTC